MKTHKLILLILMLTAWGCQEQERNYDAQSHESFNLISAKGFKIANSIIDLKERIKEDVISGNETISNFSIQGVSYVYHGDFTYALVDYRKDDGTSGNLLITNSGFTAKSLANGRNMCTTCDCFRIKCTGSCDCRVGFEPPSIEGGAPTFFCTCSDCEMDVRTYDCP
jgi:hypothetical protein